MAKMTNLEKRLARWDRFNADIQAAVEEQLKKETEDMVAALKRAAPVSDLETTPGQLRDSIRSWKDPNWPATYRIIVGAQDKKGRYFGSYVEFGHGAEDGTRVPATPFFWPTYRARRRAMRRRMLAPARKLIRALAKGG